MNAVMRPSLALTKVYLYREPVDFRKSFKGLAVLVEQETGHNPFDGYLYDSPTGSATKSNACSGRTMDSYSITRACQTTNSGGQRNQTTLLP